MYICEYLCVCVRVRVSVCVCIGGGGDAFERKFVCARDRVCACFSVYAYLLVLVCAHACVFPSVCVSVRV